MKHPSSFSSTDWRSSLLEFMLSRSWPFPVPLLGQSAATQTIGFPDDWSHRHVIFSNPGTFREALGRGEFEKWSGILNDPRFLQQRMKQNALGNAKPCERRCSGG